jgi:hypothetical protein
LRKWVELGIQVGRAIKQYFESVQQVREYFWAKSEEME